MKRLSLFANILLIATVVIASAPVQFQPVGDVRAFQFPFKGRWLPNVSAFAVGAANYVTLQNLRYSDSGIETVEGYSKITTNAMSDTPISGYQFSKEGESHIISKAYVGSTYKLYENNATIPSTGDYSASAISWQSEAYSNHAIDSSTGFYSQGPSGLMLYGDSTGAYLYGGNNIKIERALLSTSAALPLAGIFDKTDEINEGNSFSLTSSYYLYIGTPYLVRDFAVTVNTANTSASTMTVARWNGSSWATMTSTDGTSAGGITLAQTGTISITNTSDIYDPLYINGDVLIWYRFKISAGSAGISPVTLGVPFQEIKDFWNGSDRTCISFNVYRNSEYEDYTHHINQPSTKDSPFAAIVGNVDGSDYMYLMFEEPIIGLDIKMLEGMTNKISTEIANIGYWDGDSYVTLTGVVDGTEISSGSTTLSKSGIITWAIPSTYAPQKKEEFGVVGYSYRITLNGALTDAQRSITNSTLSFATSTMTETDPGESYPDIGDLNAQQGDTIYISGSLYNNSSWTISNVNQHTLDVYGTFTNETSGSSITCKVYENVIHDGTSIDQISGIAAPIDTPDEYGSRYNGVGFYAGRVMLIDGNRVDYSLPGVPWIFNGVNTSNFGGQNPTSLYFGDDSEITAVMSLSNRYGSNIIESWVVAKKTATYTLSGSQPYINYGEPFIIREMSTTFGCPAPMTMKEVSITLSDSGGGIQRNGIMWLDASGPVIFDGAVIEPVAGIENYFDKSKTECVKSSIINLSTAYYDESHMEYNLLFPSGSSATANNKWLVYDLRKRKWYEKVPSNYPVYAIEVQDDNGTKYNYGQIASGHLMRFDNTQAWDSAEITQVVKTGYFSPPISDEIGFWDRSELRSIRIISDTISEDADITTNVYGDGSLLGTSIPPVPLDASTNLSRNTYASQQVRFSNYAYQINFWTATSTKKWTPIAWGYKAMRLRED